MQRQAFETTTDSPEKTRALGRRLGRLVGRGAVIALTGDLGSGKTVFVQGLAEGLQVPAEYYITSPTFTLINEYPGRVRLYHVDLYRLDDPGAVDDIGLTDIMRDDGVTVIEWAEKCEDDLPENHLRLDIEVTDEHARRIRVSAAGPKAVDVLNGIAQTVEEKIWV